MIFEICEERSGQSLRLRGCRSSVSICAFSLMFERVKHSAVTAGPRRRGGAAGGERRGPRVEAGEVEGV